MNKLFRIDWLSILYCVLLLAAGLANIYSAAYTLDNAEVAWSVLEKQLISLGLAVVAVLLIQFLDTKFFERYASLLYLFSIFALLGLWVMGTEVSGARSWYAIGSFSLQPSEFAKVALALALAKHLGDFNTQIKRRKDYLIAFLLIGIPAGLTLLQPDAGTALVLLGFFLVLHAEGLPQLFLTCHK